MGLERVVVVGTSGAGKSTFARRAALVLDQPYVELDAIRWLADWQERSQEEFETALAPRLAEPRWVVDGNDSKSRSLIWSRATALLWLNYSFHRSFARLLRRTVRRAWTGEEVCNGNRESFRVSFFSRESVLWWALTSHPVYRSSYREEIPRHPHLDVSIFRRPDEAESFLLQLE